jgi:hypothetical protein
MKRIFTIIALAVILQSVKRRKWFEKSQAVNICKRSKKELNL